MGDPVQAFRVAILAGLGHAPERIDPDRFQRFATLQAALALKGHELRRLESGVLLVQRWGLSRELGDLDAAEAFARQVGARP